MKIRKEGIDIILGFLADESKRYNKATFSRDIGIHVDTLTNAIAGKDVQFRTIRDIANGMDINIEVLLDTKDFKLN